MPRIFVGLLLSFSTLLFGNVDVSSCQESENVVSLYVKPFNDKGSNFLSENREVFFLMEKDGEYECAKLVFQETLPETLADFKLELILNKKDTLFADGEELTAKIKATNIGESIGQGLTLNAKITGLFDVSRDISDVVVNSNEEIVFPFTFPITQKKNLEIYSLQIELSDENDNVWRENVKIPVHKDTVTLHIASKDGRNIQGAITSPNGTSTYFNTAESSFELPTLNPDENYQVTFVNYHNRGAFYGLSLDRDIINLKHARNKSENIDFSISNGEEKSSWLSGSDIDVWNITTIETEETAEEILNKEVEAGEEAQEETLKTGLVAHYEFEGNSNDSSENGNNGIAHNVTYVDGAIGQAGSFDGSSFVALDEKMKTDYTSLSAWFKTDSTKSGHENAMQLIRLRYYGYGVMLNSGEAGKLSVGLNVHASQNYRFSSEETNFNDNNWHHLVMNYSINGFQIFVDGKLEYEANDKTNSPIYHTANGGYSIGKDGNHPSDYFQGLIDDVRIYDRPFSQAEVETLYNMGK
jgi:hypothetical protein